MYLWLTCQSVTVNAHQTHPSSPLKEDLRVVHGLRSTGKTLTKEGKERKQYHAFNPWLTQQQQQKQQNYSEVSAAGKDEVKHSVVQIYIFFFFFYYKLLLCLIKYLFVRARDCFSNSSKDVCSLKYKDIRGLVCLCCCWRQSLAN